MIFGFPLSLWALFCVPVLVAIYWFRSRYRNVVVSSLVLWVDANPSSKGGRKLQKLSTPIPFYLELLILLLLLFGALLPMLRAGDQLRSLIVVLDDSYSMQAISKGQSSRDRAITEIKTALKDSGAYAIKFIVAGQTSQLLGSGVSNAPEALAQLELWQCNGPTANINSAIALANELATPATEIWVMTDTSPKEHLPEESRIRWFAVGQPVTNLAITRSSRDHADDSQRVLIEVHNFSKTLQRSMLRVTKEDDGTILLEKPLKISGNAAQRFTLDLKNLLGPITASIDDDDLAVDNIVHLFAQRNAPVRVKLAFSDQTLKTLVKRTLDSIGGITYAEHRVELLLTDQLQGADVTSDTWTMQLHRSENPQAYIGPFVLDKNHLLCQGLNLSGVVWSAAKMTALPGRPIVTAGNIPLITDDVSVIGNHTVHVAVNPERSTLTDAIGWPVLFWNLLQWRSSHFYGLQKKNLRLGDNATVRLKEVPTEVILTMPDGKRQTYTAANDRLEVRTNQVGIYRLKTPTAELAFAVNALGLAESNLQQAQTKQWGQKINEATLLKRYHTISWAFWLLALGVLVVHLAWLKRY